jgi:hypothetical protein
MSNNQSLFAHEIAVSDAGCILGFGTYFFAFLHIMPQYAKGKIVVFVKVW